MDNVTQVSVGTFSSMALQADGSLWAWGSLSHWGDYLFSSKADEVNTRPHTPVHIMDNVVAFTTPPGAGAQYHTMVIKTEGSLWGWGDNSIGQIGDGTTAFRSQPVKIMDDVVAVSTGSTHTLAVTLDGSLWAWGSGGVGELGHGERPFRQPYPIRVKENIMLP